MALMLQQTRRTHSRLIVGWSAVSPAKYIDRVVDVTVVLHRQVRTMRSVQKGGEGFQTGQTCSGGCTADGLSRLIRTSLFPHLSFMSGIAPHDHDTSIQLVLWSDTKHRTYHMSLPDWFTPGCPCFSMCFLFLPGSHVACVRVSAQKGADPWTARLQ